MPSTLAATISCRRRAVTESTATFLLLSALAEAQHVYYSFFCLTSLPHLQESHRSSLRVRKPPGGGSSIVFGDPNEHISLQYRNPDEEPIKIIGV